MERLYRKKKKDAKSFCQQSLNERRAEWCVNLLLGVLLGEGNDGRGGSIYELSPALVFVEGHQNGITFLFARLREEEKNRELHPSHSNDKMAK